MEANCLQLFSVQGDLIFCFLPLIYPDEFLGPGSAGLQNQLYQQDWKGTAAGVSRHWARRKELVATQGAYAAVQLSSETTA